MIKTQTEFMIKTSMRSFGKAAIIIPVAFSSPCPSTECA